MKSHRRSKTRGRNGSDRQTHTKIILQPFLHSKVPLSALLMTKTAPFYSFMQFGSLLRSACEDRNKVKSKRGVYAVIGILDSSGLFCSSNTTKKKLRTRLPCLHATQLQRLQVGGANETAKQRNLHSTLLQGKSWKGNRQCHHTQLRAITSHKTRLKTLSKNTEMYISVKHRDIGHLC